MAGKSDASKSGAGKAAKPRLRFTGPKAKKIASSLSAVERIGNTLWLVGDEVASIERLLADAEGNYGRHESLRLKDFFELPGGADAEADLEGIAFDRVKSCLWVVGSHSLRRGHPGKKDPVGTALAALRQVGSQPNRYLLGVIAVVDADADATLDPASARALPFSADGSDLVRLLREDRLFAATLDIPSKDNGFDIEGLAAHAGAVFLGLRGPVLDGWASILQLHPDELGEHGLSIGGDGDHPAYRHHLLDLDGLGIRDLCLDGTDLLILAGPTMLLHGPFRVYRWPGGAVATAAHILRRDDLLVLFEVPAAGDGGHPEGIAVLANGGRKRRLLMIYDRKAKGGTKKDQRYVADLFKLA